MPASHEQLSSWHEEWREYSERPTFIQRSVAGGRCSPGLGFDRDSWRRESDHLKGTDAGCAGKWPWLGAPRERFDVKSTVLLDPFWRVTETLVPPNLSQGQTSRAQVVGSLPRLGRNESAYWGAYQTPTLCPFKPQEPNFPKEEIWRDSLSPQSDFSLRKTISQRQFSPIAIVTQAP